MGLLFCQSSVSEAAEAVRIALLSLWSAASSFAPEQNPSGIAWQGTHQLTTLSLLQQAGEDKRERGEQIMEMVHSISAHCSLGQNLVLSSHLAARDAGDGVFVLSSYISCEKWSDLSVEGEDSRHDNNQQAFPLPTKINIWNPNPSENQLFVRKEISSFYSLS